MKRFEFLVPLMLVSLLALAYGIVQASYLLRSPQGQPLLPAVSPGEPQSAPNATIATPRDPQPATQGQATPSTPAHHPPTAETPRIATAFLRAVAANAAPGGRVALDGEVGLQETLDRLGFTVNVPTDFAGHHLYRWEQSHPYHTSDRSDAIEATEFAGTGTAEFTKLGVQAALGGQTTFGVSSGNDETPVFQPSGEGMGVWLAPEGAERATARVRSGSRLFIDFPAGPFGQGPLYSSPDRLMVLPALTGGHWVDNGDDTGHWEGAQKSGAYLLCWEDASDYDYQDLVISARGIQPL